MSQCLTCSQLTRRKNLCKIWKDFRYIFGWISFSYLSFGWSQFWGQYHDSLFLNFEFGPIYLSKGEKAISENRCCRKTLLLTPLENMHLAIFLLIYHVGFINPNPQKRWHRIILLRRLIKLKLERFLIYFLHSAQWLHFQFMAKIRLKTQNHWLW